MEISKLSLEDLAEVTELDKVSGNNVRGYVKSLTQGETSDVAWGLKAQNRLIGYLTLATLDSKVIGQKKDSRVLSNVYVKPEHNKLTSKFIKSAIKKTPSARTSPCFTDSTCLANVTGLRLAV